MNITLSVRSEILKMKRTASWYFLSLVATVVPTVFALTVALSPSSAEVNPWTALYVEEFKSLNLLVLPMFTILICTLLPQIEFRNTTWKQVLASPQRFSEVYLSKFMVVQLLLLLFLMLFLLTATICGLITGWVSPLTQLHRYQPDADQILQQTVRTYLSVFGLSVAQFILGMLMKNFIAPVATGFVLWLLGNLLLFEMHGWVARFFPYSLSQMVAFPKYEDQFPATMIISLGWGLLLLGAGYLLFLRKKRD
jgi:hypothetical protein